MTDEELEIENAKLLYYAVPTKAFSKLSAEDKSRVYEGVLDLLFQREVPIARVGNALEFVAGWAFDDDSPTDAQLDKDRHAKLHAVAHMYAKHENTNIAYDARHILLVFFRDFSVWDDAIREFANGEYLEAMTMRELVLLGHEPTKEALLRIARDQSLYSGTRFESLDILTGTHTYFNVFWPEEVANDTLRVRLAELDARGDATD